MTQKEEYRCRVPGELDRMSKSAWADEGNTAQVKTCMVVLSSLSND